MKSGLSFWIRALEVPFFDTPKIKEVVKKNGIFTVRYLLLTLPMRLWRLMILMEMMLELVMDMEVDKVADEVAGMEVDMEVD